MSEQHLPEGLVSKGRSPIFDHVSIPAALRDTYALGAGRWALLHVLDGGLGFVDLMTGESRAISAPAKVPIAPQAPHKLDVQGPVRMQLEFFAESTGPSSGAVVATADSATPPADHLADLDNPEAIGALVHAFYDRVAQDDLLGPVFVDQANVDWDEHRRNLTAFWCKLELGLPGFQGAPTQKHSVLSRDIPFRAEQFERWVSLFHNTVDHGWHGPRAASIKARAAMIARAQSRIVEGAEPWTGAA